MAFLPLAGVAAAFAVANASASDASIAAQESSWSPSSVTIKAGESVTWTNSGGFHNVCVQKPGTTGDTCDEFRNGEASTTWTSAAHTFSTPGTYAFFCEIHRGSGMTGTVTVEATSTGTTPPPDTMPTDTTTTPTEQTTPTDTSAPAFVGTPKRRASRKSLVLEVRPSEQATLRATVFRRPPGGRSFARVSEASVRVKQGKNVVTLPRKTGSLRSGAYRVRLQLVDAAGNKSLARTLSFKVA
jgi:plastocyanin